MIIHVHLSETQERSKVKFLLISSVNHLSVQDRPCETNFRRNSKVMLLDLPLMSHMLLQDRLRETKERRRSLDQFKPHTLPLSAQQPERTLTPRSLEQHKHIIRQSGYQIQPKDFHTQKKNTSVLHQGKNSHTSTPSHTRFSSSEDLHRYQTSQERDETTLRIAAFVGAGEKLGLGLQQDKAGKAITISGLADDGTARRCEVIRWVCDCPLECCRGLQHGRAREAFSLSGLVDDGDVRRCDCSSRARMDRWRQDQTCLGPRLTCVRPPHSIGDAQTCLGSRLTCVRPPLSIGDVHLAMD